MSSSGPNEADTCADFVLPAIEAVGWVGSQITEQFPVQAELHIPIAGSQAKRRADYVLEFSPGVPLAVIEAKRLWASPGDGLQQAIRYAAMLDAPFALSTNGKGWELHNLIDGLTTKHAEFPTPIEAWDLFTESHGLNAEAQQLLVSRFSDHHRSAADQSVRRLRYYQRRAVHEVLAALSRGDRRMLLVMATGTGKTFTAMQLVWKLWNYRRKLQQSNNALRNYRVLYLADRKILVDDPLKKTFRLAFPEAAIRVSSANLKHSPDIYFATYQAMDASTVDQEDDTGEKNDLLSQYPPDFFDLVIVDECHRGSAREESSWREILNHFASAAQLGMTATPVNKGTADTFEYFGNPLYEYSLRQGIEDGFLAPYTIRRVEFDVDESGLEIAEGLTDAAGRELPAGVYTTRDFERTLRLPDRTQAMARVIDRVVGDTTDRAVVFCVDKDHALEMVTCLRNLRPERTRVNAEWVARIMTAEREKDRLLEEFTDPERTIPQIAVTTRLLSTGVDIQDLRYVVIARAIGTVPEFKQIIGRGTRLYPEKGKYEFEIIDFVNATATFSDPSFDGPPLKKPIIDVVDEDGALVDTTDTPDTGDEGEDPDTTAVEEPPPPFSAGGSSNTGGSAQTSHAPEAKFELRGIVVEIASEGFWVHDLESGKPRLVSYTDWTRDLVLEAFSGPDELLAAWSAPDSRSTVVSLLASARIDPARLTVELGLESGAPIDTVDQLIQLAWNHRAPTRAERARRAHTEHRSEFESLGERARVVLEILLDLYAKKGIDEVSSPEIVSVPPLSDRGTAAQIASDFGGPAHWHEARTELQRWLYSA
ncbi:MAG: DEAD/DEAH box helicase family protein [Lacisediminihabitans sp.]